MVKKVERDNGGGDPSRDSCHCVGVVKKGRATKQFVEHQFTKELARVYFTMCTAWYVPAHAGRRIWKLF